MWIVSLALRRPYTFIVLALTIMLLGIFSILRMPTDIFPNINIPVVAVLWNYSGLSPENMASRIVLGTERTAQTTITNIEHVESQSLTDRGIVKYFFQPGVNEELAYAQITGVSQSLLRQMPPGTTPPFILAYNASTVPILQLSLSSNTLSEAQMFDLANYRLRIALATVRGAAIPYPFGGLQRQVQVDLDPQALRSTGLSPAEVSAAIGAQNLILPAGTQKIGQTEYFIDTNGAAVTTEELNDIPVRTKDGTTTYIRDIGHVRDGFPPQTNLVRRDGKHAVLMSVLKTGSASTLDIIRDIKSRLPQIRDQLPADLKIDVVGDQSVFVSSAIEGVIREAVIAAALTALMILLFLGSWRSTIIIAVSIPLSILASIICLSALGETINIMTLGGLALAVGILVDDATVTIENINSHLENGDAVTPAILKGAQQIALPALVSTLAICIVFIPMLLLAGIAKYLFVPLAEAVVFAMLASYLLSRTLVPTLANYWLKPHTPGEHVVPTTWLGRRQAAFEAGFESVRERYRELLEKALAAGPRFAAPFLLFMAATALLAFPFGKYLPGLGQDFFPTVDGGLIKLHLRAPTGVRIDETARLCDAVETTIRDNIPASEVASIVDNLGVPYSSINTTYSTSGAVGMGDADIYVTLNEGHRPTEDYVRKLRSVLNDSYPGVIFSFQAADIVGQILNFGLPAPIDIQIAGIDVAANRAYANELLPKLKRIPGMVDLHIHQAFDYPKIEVDVNRSKAALLGLTEQTIASNLLISLSGSAQTAPSFWIEPKSGSTYSVTTQTPQYRLTSLADLMSTPITTPDGKQQLLSNVATFHRTTTPAIVNHYNSQTVIDFYGAVDGTDLGYVASQIKQRLAETAKSLPKGSTVVLRGQAETMSASFNGLLLGLAGAVILIYLLMVVNFQSWLDPFIIITALPAALAGIVWMLFLTHTSVSVPALTGAIMCMGVATANSVLIVSFARDRMNAGERAMEAAWLAGFTRFRPVLMTALAMIIGMIPMALGLGDGGEQNAPLGRAVIGGLIFATLATLFFVPTVFTIIHGRPAASPRDSGSTDTNSGVAHV